MCCFVCCWYPGLAGNGWEIGRVVAKLLSEAGKAENLGESCFCEDAGLAFPPVRLQRAWMLLCTPPAAGRAPSAVGGPGGGQQCGWGAASGGEQRKANHRRRENTCSPPGAGQGLISMASERYSLFPLGHFPFASNQITF